MNIYSKKQVWKAFLLLGGLAIALSSLLYTNSIVNKLAVEEEKKVELVAEATKLLANIENNPTIKENLSKLKNTEAYKELEQSVAEFSGA